MGSEGLISVKTPALSVHQYHQQTIKASNKTPALAPREKIRLDISSTENIVD